MIEILIWGNVMNIDVYMSAKDFGNVAGLCGNFDGDISNDLEHRDGTISDDYNRSYKFADSWRFVVELLPNFIQNTFNYLYLFRYFSISILVSPSVIRSMSY
jgi:hypothetical protein